MGLKAKFIMFCEQTKVANEARGVKGPKHPDTITAYSKANELKREILEALDEDRHS